MDQTTISRGVGYHAFPDSYLSPVLAHRKVLTICQVESVAALTQVEVADELEAAAGAMAPGFREISAALPSVWGRTNGGRFGERGG